MHYVHAKTLLSAQNGMNLYRGCTHGCIYCDSRSVCYHIDHAFEDIEIKQNALVLLEDALRRKRKKCMIGTGSMSDCYLPLEMELGYTRRALQLLYDYGFGVAVQTKSDRILRDLELLKKINGRAKAVVQMTLTTWDDGLCRILEPNVCPTSARLEALRAFQQAGVPTVVWLCPILPFLNDTAENLSGILRGCAEAGVKGIVYFGAGVTLREGSREYFYAQLDRHFPGLKERYIRTYGDAYELLSPADRELSPLFHAFCEDIEKAIRQNQVRLLIIDPVQAFIGADVDMNRANEVRPVFRKLGMIAEKTGCAIVLIGHLNINPSHIGLVTLLYGG